MNLGNTCCGSKLEGSSLKLQKKESERGGFILKGKVPDSSFFCSASPAKTDGQVFTAAVVAPHQGFGVHAALQRLGTTRNLSGKIHFSTRRCGDGDTLDDAAVQGLERMLRVKAQLETVSAGRCGVSGGSSRGCGGETVFETAHPTAGESTMDIELHEVHESERVDSQAQKSCGGFGAAETAALATAGSGAHATEGIIGLHEVSETDFPSLPNSSQSPNSCFGSSSSACARRVARVACCWCVLLVFASVSSFLCGVCCCCTCACVDPAR